MDPRLLRHYNQELQHLREMGAEFARQFPKIAGRLGIDGIEVADPYVERLLEGVAFMAARVQVKLDAEFPRFTQRLTELVYPNYLAPTPSMLIAQLRPQLTETNLAEGFVVPRGSMMRSASQRGDSAACAFRTAHDVTLWPMELVSAKYFSFAPDLPLTALPVAQKIKGGVRLRLKATAGLIFNNLKLDSLQLYFGGGDEVAYRLHELCHGSLLGVLAAPAKQPWPWYEFIEPTQCRSLGYEDNQALLPVAGRSFQGYRLLQEYFSFPQRFLFFDIQGLGSAVKRHDGDELEIVLLFESGDAVLESVVDTANFTLNCTPAINLFSKRAERIQLSDKNYEYHVVPDRTRPMDYEVYEVESVTGYGVGTDSEQNFRPLYSSRHGDGSADQAYFTVQRELRLPSEKQRRNGFRSSYIGSEVFLSLVDANDAPLRSDLKQAAITTLCTNRDLPLLLPLGSGKTDFVLDSAAPLDAIRCIKGPSKPYSPLAQGSVAWRLISHLSLNYLSLIDNNEQAGAAALREMLELYATTADAGMRKQIEGLRSVRARSLVRRLPATGPICFGRGLEIELEVDDLAFQGGSAFLFGSVLERFFARYVSINSFAETVLRSDGRGEIMRWELQWGKKPIL
ncbi:MAG: type VI secretion system baseplate subunit TssF [Pseudolabrys sp.]